MAAYVRCAFLGHRLGYCRPPWRHRKGFVPSQAKLWSGVGPIISTVAASAAAAYRMYLSRVFPSLFQPSDKAS